MTVHRKDISMKIEIRRAKEGDAQIILEFSKVIGSETDNLSFGEAGIPITVEQEKEFLSSVLKSEKDIFLVAFQDGDLVGTASYLTFSQKRMSHRGEIAPVVWSCSVIYSRLNYVFFDTV